MRAWVLLCLAGCGRINFDPQTDVVEVGASVQLVVGGGGGCVRNAEGGLFCWGGNNHGELGDGSTKDSFVPIQVATVTAWADFALGGSHACGIDMQGAAWCWGYNSNGQLGIAGLTCGDGIRDAGEDCDDSNTVNNDGCSAICSTVDPAPDVLVPTKLPGTRTYRRIFAQANQTFAIATDGTLWAWGRGGAGELGLDQNGNAGDRGKPQQVKILAPQIGVDDQWLTVSPGDDHTCAIQNDGSLWCWGSNGNGQLCQNGSASVMRNIPEVVSAGSTWMSVAAGRDFEVAVTGQSLLYGCGRADENQLGLGTMTDTNLPTLVDTGGTYSVVSAGLAHACGLRTDHVLACWGSNTDGQTGTGDTLPKPTPTAVEGTWTDVQAGTSSTCAIDTTGAVWCWGQGNNGRLGNGLTDSSSVPVQATGR